jgi:hypothetical protein
MTVEQTSVIDAAGIDGSGALRLTIADTLEWNGDHLQKLQDKINAYLVFIESGEIFSAYPQAKDRDFRIDVELAFRPSAEAAAFLDQASAIIEDAGYLFSYGPAPAGYADKGGE